MKATERYKCCDGAKSHGHRKDCRFHPTVATVLKKQKRLALQENADEAKNQADKKYFKVEDEQRSDPTRKSTKDTQSAQDSTAHSRSAGTGLSTRKNSGMAMNRHSLNVANVDVKSVRLSGLAQKLRSRVKDTAPHLIVQARAGTGKTTTIVEALRRLFDNWQCKACNGKGKTYFSQAPTVRPCENCGGLGHFEPLIPSVQQKKIWEQIELSKGIAKSVCFVAFNNTIADELKRRVPIGCDAMTMHSMGFKAIRKSFELFPGEDAVNSFRVHGIIAELTAIPLKTLQVYHTEFLETTVELVGLCKQNLVGLSNFCSNIERDQFIRDLNKLVEHHDLALNGNRTKIFDLIPQILERCKDVAKDRCVDFNDMIWVPFVLGLHVTRYDLLMVDEAQDLNRAQQALAKLAGERLVLVGDDMQAIYGFAGADSESLWRMLAELRATERSCEKWPLTITYRCSQAVVREAQKTVPDIEAHEDNPEGAVKYAQFKNVHGRVSTTWLESVQDGDMVICRCNAPVVGQCFRLLKMGKRAYIQGRDVMAGLIKLVKKMKANDVPDLISKLGNWLIDQQAKERAKPKSSDMKLLAMKDKFDCILCFAEEAKSIQGVIDKIDSLFSDETRSGIRLSSIHKAKGLEAPNVFFLMPEEAQCPHPMAKLEWEYEQETHLLYVGQTRARLELTYVC